MGIIGYHWVCHWVRVSSGVIGCHRVVVGSVFIEIVKKSIKIMKIIRKIIEFIKNHSKSLKIFKIIANHYIFRFPNAISVKSLNFDCRAFPTGEFDCRSPPESDIDCPSSWYERERLHGYSRRRQLSWPRRCSHQRCCFSFAPSARSSTRQLSWPPFAPFARSSTRGPPGSAGAGTGWC